MQHSQPSIQKLSSQSARSLISLAVLLVALTTMTSTVFGQHLLVKSKTATTKSVSERAAPPEDVFFNADAREVSAPASLAANQVSATSIGSVLSLLFDSARVSLQTEGDPLVATWAATVTVPTNSAAKPKAKTYLQHIRASLIKDANSRVSIFLQLGGKSFVAEFPYGMKHSGDMTRKFISVITPGSAASYTASFVIYAERRNSKSALLVDIDALDVDAR